uniref:Uncharacterized protein n=2 Tax=Aegilops tauschii subsp. strangulata TaxID=200361 RepID=A0A453QYA1_AEGTS
MFGVVVCALVPNRKMSDPFSPSPAFHGLTAKSLMTSGTFIWDSRFLGLFYFVHHSCAWNGSWNYFTLLHLDPTAPQGYFVPIIDGTILELTAGEEKTREILSKIEDRISTPQVHKVIHDLKSSCADLHNVVDDPLPAAKAAADKVLAARMDKAVHINDEFNNHGANCSVAGPSAVNDQGETLRKGTPSSLMDWNPTAQSLLWEDSLDPDGSRSQSHRPHLPSPRRISVSPLQVAENKARRRRARRWSSVEEETLRKGVEQFGSSNWKDILIHNPDAFIGRTTVDLKDKWRNMMR